MLKITITFFNIIAFTTILIGQASFRETALEWGIEHRAHGVIGGGVAIFDYNNDGFQDIYFTGGHYRDELFRNNGNKTFTRVTRHAGLHLTSYFNTMAVITGDINNDGYTDLFISTDSGSKCLLFLNNKDGTFSEIGNKAGITGTQWAMGATFGDFNLDGFLDIYVTGYIQSHKSIVDENGKVVGFNHSCFKNKLFINNGDLTFKENTEINNGKDDGCGLTAIASDLNNDNIPDIYVVNDFGEWVKPNSAFINNYPETGFTETGASLGLDAGIYGMGIAVGDYNRDGLLDYYITNLGSNVLYKNMGEGTFIDVAEVSGVSNTWVDDKLTTGWGTAFLDYDLDGYQDLFVANGYIPAAKFIENNKLDPNKLYKNQGDGTFSDVSELEGMADTKIARGMAFGDLNNDGDIDIVVATIGMDDTAGNVLVYENIIDNSNHWLKVTLEGTASNRDGYGAKVKLFKNKIEWIHEINGGSSHGSHNSKIAHFGLENYSNLDSMVIIWPGSKKQKFLNVETNQHLIVREDFQGIEVAGCMDISSENYNANATYNQGCFIPAEGCMDENSPEFDPKANIQNGPCGDLITGIEKLNEEKINISQDAANLYIRTSQYSNLQLIDLTGKTHHFSSFSNSYIMNKSNLRPGMYVLMFYSNKSKTVKKIMIQ
ncbi:MAG: FG-GAP-like repeat-containing protein [Bacteroidota bacterium]|nr:FG-GAP-like repeat-containing protein [Bacteroidota bacterium]